MKRYRVLEEPSRDFLEKAVEILLLQGWKPLGGVSILEFRGNFYFYQAMIKESSYESL